MFRGPNRAVFLGDSREGLNIFDAFIIYKRSGVSVKGRLKLLWEWRGGGQNTFFFFGSTKGVPKFIGVCKRGGEKIDCHLLQVDGSLLHKILAL